MKKLLKKVVAAILTLDATITLAWLKSEKAISAILALVLAGFLVLVIVIPKISFGTKTLAFLISFFAAIILIFGMIAIAAKRRKARTTSTAEKKYNETKPEKAYPKKTRNLGWLWTILTLAVLGLVVWKVIVPIIAAEGKPDFTLTSSPESGYIKLPMKRVITVEVMPNADTTALGDTTDYALESGEEDYYAEEDESYWTDWLVRPPGSPAFWYDISDEIEDQLSYGDEVGEPGDLNPLQREYVEKYITGVRFRNTGEKPVIVRIHLSGSF